MPPRKKLNSSSSSKKSNPNQPSQRSKFGIQHFFERHSQNTAHPRKCNSRVSASSSSVPVPENGAVPAPCSSVPSSGDLGNSKIEGPFGPEVIDLTLPESDLKVSGVNDVVLASKKAYDNSNSLESIANNPSLDKSSEELMIIGVNAAEENISEASPEVCKSVPLKRFKFSPGMLIKESQDDGSDEIIWKISPVNERLHAVSKQMPETLRVLAESSRLNCMKIRQCSQNKAPPCKTEKIEKSTSSPVLKSSESSLVSMGVVRPKRFMSDKGIDCNKILSNNGSNSEVDSSQSPFRTPPSLSYCQDKVAQDVTSRVAANQLNLRQHKRALLELLDQVEDVISIDNSSVNDLEDYPSKVKGRKFEKQLVTTDPALNIMAVDVPKKITGGFNFDFLVLEVSEKCGSADSSAVQTPYKVLRLLNEKNGQERAAYLWQEWSYSAISPGDTVNVIGEFDDQGRCNIDHNNNFIILHPDILVSGTRVAASFSCPRRTVLDERLKCNEHSTSALLGTLLHQIFQAGLTNDLPNKAFLEEYARIVVQQNMENVYACGAKENDINKAILEAIPKLLRWINLFKHSKVHEAPTVEFRSDEGRKRISISEVIDIEEMAWAPRYGLKGMIDASLRVNVALDENQVTESIMPLEFKTGKMSTGQSSMEHIAQVILYTLLMSERYQKPIGSGLLYYLQSDLTQGISVQRPDIVGLIMRRNEFANDIHNASKKQSLPPMLQSLSMCRGCRHLDFCTIYHKAHGGNTEGSGLGNLFDSRTQHLTGAHGQFLRHWERLIDLEAKESQLVKKQRWNSRNSNNDQLPSSLFSMILDASEEHPLGNIQKDNRYVYRFVSPELSSSRLEEFGEDSFNSSSSSNDFEGSLKKGDHVIVSTESGNLNVASGIITDINHFHVIVSFSKRLRLPESSNSSEANGLLQQVWKIHKDILMSIFAVMRFNLVQLFLQDVHSAHLRKLIVNLEPPRFDIGCTFSQDPAVSYVWSEKNLNDDQRRAILKILTAKDYALILGMPGTGKTSTLVHAVKALLIRGASILLTSYTNSAIDNLLIKLRAQNIDFVRIGRYDAVHEEIRGHCFSEVHSVEDIRMRMDQIKVVAVTCLGITSPLLANKRFDICIMDEAGQTTLPVSLGPLMFASAFVLVGDHYQLPPLIQSVEARENGMGISLFCRLSEAHTQAISALQSQYRMCQGIMELSNALIYGDRLRCGSQDIANAKLEHSNLNSHPIWLKKVLNPSKPVIFINTDLLPAYEAKDHKALNNHVEAQILAEVTQGLVSTGINGNAIGIITPYNAQANLIRLVVNLTSVEIHTIDKYQGRDKECVLVSFVRSTENPKNCTSSLLGDWHRINVAITRAKKKLIMVGSSKTLSRIPLLKLLIEKVDEQSGILTVSNKDILHGRGLRRCSNIAR